MGKKTLSERKGWIETFYGDYWVKRKKLVIAGLFLPLIFSFFLLLEVNCVLSVLYDLPYNHIMLYNRFIVTVGIGTIVAIFLISTVFFVLFSRHSTSYYGMFREPLEVIHQEIYVQKKPDPYIILVKSLCISCLRSAKKIFHLLAFYLGVLVAFVPSIIVGYLIFTWIDLFFLPEMANFLSIIPAIGDVLTEIVHFLLESVVSEAGVALQNIPVVYHTILLALPLLLLLPISDRIETSVHKRQRGNIANILGNGLRFIMANLNLPSKMGGFVYTTFLCLFTDQHCVSIDIPVVNSGNIQLAMQNVLGRNQKHYTAKLPLDPQEIMSQLEKFPEDILKEVEKVFKEEIIEGRLGKAMKTLWENEHWRETMEKQREHFLKAIGGLTLIVGGNQDGVMAYAIVSKPPPAYMTRIIQRFWCSDPTVKSRIIDEINKLEFT